MELCACCVLVPVRFRCGCAGTGFFVSVFISFHFIAFPVHIYKHISSYSLTNERMAYLQIYNTNLLRKT